VCAYNRRRRRVLTIPSLRTFDPDFPSILTGVRVSKSIFPEQADEESEHQEDDVDYPVFHGPLEPTTYQKIQPWFSPASYRFLPRPLSYVLVASIPFIVPAIPLVVGAFACQRLASRVRIRKHFRKFAMTPTVISGFDTSDAVNPSGESERRYLDECPQRTMEEFK
jgi:hypothetical protein